MSASSSEVNGSNSYLAAYPDDDLYVVALSNLQRGGLTDLGKGLAALALGADPPKLIPSPPSVPWTAEERKRRIGKFFSQSQGYGVELTERNDGIDLRWGNSPDTVFISSLGPSKAYNRQNAVSMELGDANTLVMRWSDGVPQEFKRTP